MAVKDKIKSIVLHQQHHHSAQLTDINEIRAMGLTFASS